MWCGAGSARSEGDPEAQVVSNLDRFFGDDGVWERVVQVAGGAQMTDCTLGKGIKIVFRVHVPKQYPGVQFRRSKRLGDRYERYAKDGALVAGSVEDGGEWLRIGHDLFLPMRIGNITILEELQDGEPVDRVPTSPSTDEPCGAQGWWACGQAASVARDAASPAKAKVRSAEAATDEVPAALTVLVDSAAAGDRHSALFSKTEHPQAASPNDAPVSGSERWSSIPEAVRRDPLANLEAAALHLSGNRINPFSDTPRDRALGVRPAARRAAARTAIQV